MIGFIAIVFITKLRQGKKTQLQIDWINCNLFGFMVPAFRLHIGSIRLIGYHSLAEGYVANVLVDGCTFIAFVWANSHIKKAYSVNITV